MRSQFTIERSSSTTTLPTSRIWLFAMSIRIESETARTNSYFSGCFAPGASSSRGSLDCMRNTIFTSSLTRTVRLSKSASNPMPFKSSSGERKNTGSSPYAMRVS